MNQPTSYLEYSDSRECRLGKQFLPKPQTAGNSALVSTSPHHAVVGQPSLLNGGHRHNNTYWYPCPSSFSSQAITVSFRQLQNVAKCDTTGNQSTHGPATGTDPGGGHPYYHSNSTLDHMRGNLASMWLDSLTKSIKTTTTVAYRQDNAGAVKKPMRNPYHQDHVTPAQTKVTIEILDNDDDNDAKNHALTEPMRKDTMRGRKRHRSDHRTSRGFAAGSGHSERYQAPTDEQLWGSSLKCSMQLRNHLRSAFQPKRWPAFCKSKGYLLPRLYKPGCGLGLVDPENESFNVDVITGFVEHLIAIGEPPNVGIHCVSFLQQMTLMEAQRYKLSFPETFHIGHIAPQLRDLVSTEPPRKISKTTNTNDTSEEPWRTKSLDADATEGLVDGHCGYVKLLAVEAASTANENTECSIPESRHESVLQTTDEDCADDLSPEPKILAVPKIYFESREAVSNESETSEGSVQDNSETYHGSVSQTSVEECRGDFSQELDMFERPKFRFPLSADVPGAVSEGSLFKERLRASLLDLSEKIDEVLATRLDFVNGELLSTSQSE